MAATMLALSLWYLVPFVPRGWFPHDEGMLGQAAERVLAGEAPHVDYDEPYTGALTRVHALVFRVFGTDLVHIRWLMFAGALVAQITVYALLRRYLRPLSAAAMAWVALVWSFPNYFSGLPSWWLLIFALLSLWGLVRFAESGRLLFAVIAGAAVGVAITIKQTGVYFVIPLLMSLWLAREAPATSVSTTAMLMRVAIAGGAIGFVGILLRSRLDASHLLYLAVPVAAACAAFVAADSRRRLVGSSLLSVGAGVLGLCLPVGLFLAPYWVAGELGAFFDGAVLQPQTRVTFASRPLPPAAVSLYAIIGLVCLLPVGASHGRKAWIIRAARWSVAGLLFALSLRFAVAYQVIWQSARTFAACVPIAALWLLARGEVQGHANRVFLFATSSMFAWGSLVQFPFGAPIYFCYVAPLALVAGTAAIQPHVMSAAPWIRPWLVLVFCFAIFSMNRSYPGPLGGEHKRMVFDRRLALPKATLVVSGHDAAIYRRVVLIVVWNLRGGTLWAGPDCPEIYFLTGQRSPSGTLFDFLTQATGSSVSSRTQAGFATETKVVVINLRPEFSPAISQEALSELRASFPHSEIVDRFEVRWR